MQINKLKHALAWRIRKQFTFALPMLFKLTLNKKPYPVSVCNSLNQLEKQYNLKPWAQVCTAKEWQENLYILDLLDQHLEQRRYHHCLDIGCKYGTYFPALASFSHTSWDGIELDVFRRYWNLASRRDHGDFMAKPFNCCYVPGSLLDLKTNNHYQLITWFLPFVAETALTAWQLPRRFYQPTALLQHAYNLLAPGGTLFIVNQGEWETGVQQRLFIATSIQADFLGQVDSEFSPFQQPRFGWRINKPQ